MKLDLTDQEFAYLAPFTHTQGDCDVTTSIEQRTVTVCKDGSLTVIRLPLPIPLE
jgi:hypothetical protein